jgi:hypothetical protein
MAVATGVIEHRGIVAAVAGQGKATQGGGATVQDVATHLPLAGVEVGRIQILKAGTHHGT